MDINILTISTALINFSILFAIIIVLLKSIKGIKNFINRNKELDNKLDIILSKLDEKDNKK